MPSVSVAYRTGNGGPVMSVQIDGDKGVYSMVSTPPELSVEWGAPRLDSSDRPALKPITFPSGRGLRKFSFEHTVWATNTQASVDDLLVGLRKIAETGKKVRFYNAGWIASDTWWWVESCKPMVEQMGDGNRANRVKVSWSLTEAVTFNKVDWARTPPQEQPPIKIEAKGPEQAETDTSSSGDSEEKTENGVTPGKVTTSIADPSTPKPAPGAGSLKLF